MENTKLCYEFVIHNLVMYCFYLPRARLHQRGQVWEPLADGESVIERGAVPRASQGIGQQSGEEDGQSVAELTG